MAEFFAAPQCPKGPVDVILDTDTYNEIDDQFAIAYMLHAPEKLRVRAVCAAPFLNAKSESPADGMEKSYHEIIKILTLAGRQDLVCQVYRGSTEYLPDENTPVESEAARKIAAIAMEYTKEKPLYVVAIGAITNVASALLMQPEIREKMVVVWLGGHDIHWPDNKEFNLMQDVASARIIFGCGVRLVQLPCMGVVSAVATTGPELIHWLRGKGPLCDYLCDNTIQEAESYAKGKAWSRVIWDITAIGWLLNDDNRLMQSREIPSPIPQYDHHFSFDPRRHPMTYVWHINRDAIFTDLFTRLTKGK
ncbi:MAG: nucleoside hydrolase [Clostridiales bacterium]|nr:nucleoside hydrolase [Clostridiales bacterium]